MTSLLMTSSSVKRVKYVLITVLTRNNEQDGGNTHETSTQGDKIHEINKLRGLF